MGRCCGSRDEDGTVDREEIDRAVNGRAANLTRTERELTVWRLSTERGWGLNRISEQLGISRSQAAAIMARQRRAS